MKIAIVTDSNSGITQEQAKELGVYVIPMPFFIDGQQYFEGINLTQEEFYEKLKNDADISTSQPSVGELQDEWDKLLKKYDEIVFIPMSSGLSGTCQTAVMLSGAPALCSALSARISGSRCAFSASLFFLRMMRSLGSIAPPEKQNSLGA